MFKKLFGGSEKPVQKAQVDPMDSINNLNNMITTVEKRSKVMEAQMKTHIATAIEKNKNKD